VLWVREPSFILCVRPAGTAQAQRLTRRTGLCASSVLRSSPASRIPCGLGSSLPTAWRLWMGLSVSYSRTQAAHRCDWDRADRLHDDHPGGLLRAVLAAVAALPRSTAIGTQSTEYPEYPGNPEYSYLCVTLPCPRSDRLDGALPCCVARLACPRVLECLSHIYLRRNEGSALHTGEPRVRARRRGTAGRVGRDERRQTSAARCA
jgi:hypothetical protein